MTDRTYTQSEVDILLAAEREAVLRKAFESCVDEAEGWKSEGMYHGQAEGAYSCSNAIYALIQTGSDQPSTLDALIGSAYLDAADVSAAFVGVPVDGYMMSMRAPTEDERRNVVLRRTPADALAALDSVREAERERCAKIADGMCRPVGEHREYFWVTDTAKRIAAAIRGE